MSPINKIFKLLFGKKDVANQPIVTVQELPLQQAVEYEAIIGQYIPYFHTLSEADKKKFVNRTWHFRHYKRFHFVGMTAQAEVPVLVSAAAVQLTFGLGHYQLDFFRDIYIMPDAYQYEQATDLYVGHVSPQGIFISWKHFLQGYSDASDNVNVAMHEMAHAIEHNNFMSNAGVDWEFRQDFQKLAAVFGPALADVMVSKRSYLRTYAFLNLQEFWAVSVEAFFENPRGLKDNMPRLYSVIAEILNQDPAVSTLVDKIA
jgi:MtfA peptidase